MENRVKQNNPTSAYDNHIDAERYTRKAIEKGTPIDKESGRFDLETGQRVGTGPHGGTQTKIRLHMDSKGNVHSHPAGKEY
jgi:hypothetical protein